jgi:hypothetical protein
MPSLQSDANRQGPHMPAKSTAPSMKPPAGKRGRGRLGKAALGRAKMATIAISVVAFVGALAGISQANPQTATAHAAPQDSQPAAVVRPAPVRHRSISLAAPQDPSQVVLPPLPQAPNITFRPYTRTRGS